MRSPAISPQPWLPQFCPQVQRLVRRWHDGNVRSGPAPPMSHATPVASVGIAGVNTHPLYAATLGIAGNWGSTLRPHLQHITAASPVATSTRLGDRAASACWAHACYLIDYSYVSSVASITSSTPSQSTSVTHIPSGTVRLPVPASPARRIPQLTTLVSRTVLLEEGR